MHWWQRCAFQASVFWLTLYYKKACLCHRTMSLTMSYWTKHVRRTIDDKHAPSCSVIWNTNKWFYLPCCKNNLNKQLNLSLRTSLCGAFLLDAGNTVYMIEEDISRLDIWSISWILFRRGYLSHYPATVNIHSFASDVGSGDSFLLYACISQPFGKEINLALWCGVLLIFHTEVGAWIYLFPLGAFIMHLFLFGQLRESPSSSPVTIPFLSPLRAGLCESFLLD